MDWNELKSKVRQLLLSRNLANPNIRLNALNNLEKLFKVHFTNIITDPKILLRYEKNNFKRAVSSFKKLNSAESSIINNLYYFLEFPEGGSQIIIPIATGKSDAQFRKHSDAENKLIPIAELISGLLHDKFKLLPSYALETKQGWLKNSPLKDDYEKEWMTVKRVYSNLVDNQFDLDSMLEKYCNQINYGLQKIDIWFDEPFNFVVEFDEPQHFNQFRLRTLNYLSVNDLSLDLRLYKLLCSEKIVKPGSSGFQRLKSPDPLFPEMLTGNKQDNRIRQRAFRDYLKDITPLLRGFNTTIRISYITTNQTIKDFSENELRCVRDYILNNEFLNKINLK